MVASLIPQPVDDLLKYAESNLWSNPYDNQQFRLKLGRLSPRSGWVNTFLYMHKNRGLPTATDFYHVYTLSGTSTGYWNMLTNGIKKNPLDVWYNVGDLCAKRGVHIDLYNDTGRIYPRGMAWVTRTYDGLHLLAVQKTAGYPLEVADNFFMRCYTPDWSIYHADTHTGDPNNAFQYQHFSTPSASELNQLASKLATWAGLGGLTSIYINGIRSPKLPAITEVTPGMVVEIMFDPTVFKTETYNIKDLPNFYSFDDCDFYLIDPKGRGLFFNLNAEDAVRQLTHRDYAVAADYLTDLGNTEGSFNVNSANRLLVVYRSSLWRQKMVWEHNRIKYLYRLSDAQIVSAFTAVKSTLPEWSAPELENSWTMRINRSLWNDITDSQAAEALGYNALTKIMADSPVPMRYTPEGGGYDVPSTYRRAAVVFEYDEGGVLLGYNQIVNALKYRPVNPQCVMVEFIQGYGGLTRNIIDGVDDVVLSSVNGYRAFVSGFNIDKQESDGNWVDVTNTTAYSLQNGVLSWNIDTVNQIGRVIIDDQFLMKEFDINHLDQSLYFSVTEVWEGGGKAAEIAPANLFIWMNKRPLIENVDYVVDYPHVYIVSKMYVSGSPSNSFLVVAEGISTDINKPINETELGYVTEGQLGYNGRYNVRDDRRTRIIVDGRLQLPGTIPSSEENAVFNPEHSLNGFPYAVTHVYQAVSKVKAYDNHPGYLASRDLDRRVSAYLTTNFIKKPVDTPNIQDKYRLFSLFLHQIIYAIKLGILNVPKPEAGKVFSTQVLQELTNDYQWLLKFDPAKRKMDARYFTVQTYANIDTLAVTPAQLLFISQLNDHFLSGACHIEGHFEVANNV